MTPSNLPANIPSLSDRCAPTVRLPNCGLPDNSMTQCVKREVELWSRIAFNPTFPLLRLPARYRALSISPFDVQPWDATPLNQQGATGLFSTITAGVYTPVVSYLVPAGYDGVINNTMNKFVPQSSSGPALQDGSGMITWSIAINNYLVINYSDIIMQMGDTTALGPTFHHGGIRIKANDTVTMYAVASVAGAAFLDPNGLIIGAFRGWIYANR